MCHSGIDRLVAWQDGKASPCKGPVLLTATRGWHDQPSAPTGERDLEQVRAWRVYLRKLWVALPMGLSCVWWPVGAYIPWATVRSRMFTEPAWWRLRLAEDIKVWHLLSVCLSVQTGRRLHPHHSISPSLLASSPKSPSQCTSHSLLPAHLWHLWQRQRCRWSYWRGAHPAPLPYVAPCGTQRPSLTAHRTAAARAKTHRRAATASAWRATAPGRRRCSAA